MDKYEYRLKAEQIETQVKKKDYQAAAKIADTVDWRRVKNLNMLYMVSEIYEKTERYGECMEILDMAYDRAPVGRMMLYRMTEVCTKMHNFEEAISLYREFVKAAPHDQSRFILKYQIYRERGSSVEDQIKILNEYKTHEYQEKWAYELAALYDEAGMPEECVRECDELILWFSEGEYVMKALELKMKYEPLTVSQQEKYNYQRLGAVSDLPEEGGGEPELPGFDSSKFSTVNLQAELAENLDELLKEDATIDLPDLELAGAEGAAEPEEEAEAEPEEDLREDATIELPDLGLSGDKTEVDTGEEAETEPEEDLRENATIELPDLGLSGDETEEDTGEEAEAEPEEDLREDATIELPDLGLSGDKTEADTWEEPEGEPEEDLREDATIELPDLGLSGDKTEADAGEEAETEPEEDLREDATIELPDLGLDGDKTEADTGEESEGEPEEDLREDATIELPDLGLSGDKTEADTGEEPEAEPEEDLREDATIELPDLGLDGDGAEADTGEESEGEPEEDLREDATIELPDLGLDGDDGAADAEEGPEKSSANVSQKSFLENATTELPVLGAEKKAAEPEEEKKDTGLDGEDADAQFTGPISIDDILGEWEQKKAQTAAKLEAAAQTEKVRREKVKQETAELMKLITGASEDLPKDVRRILEEIDEEHKISEESVVTEDDLPPDLDTEEEPEAELDIESLEDGEERGDSGRRENLPEESSGNMIQDLKRSLASKVSEGAVSAGHLTREQARLFAYFTSVQGMSEQLSVLFKEAYQGSRTSSSSGNLTITGERGNGKTTLAIDIVKALQKQDRIGGKRLAKISGQKLNTKDIYDVLTQLKGGALIVESAGGISDATMMAMSLAMETDTGGLVVILEDTAEEIQKLFLRNRNFASKFDHTIDIPVFTNDELVAFGKSYALEQEYSFDEFGILALYDRIGSRQTNDHLVTVAEVKEIIDDAIEHAEKGGIRHLIDRVTRKSVDEFGNRLIREADFTE